MGVDAVAMVENANDISLDDFIRQMKQNRWGVMSCEGAPLAPDDTPWIEFEWEGGKYFSLACTPRYRRLLALEYDFERDEFQENPDFDPEVQLRFLRIMRAAEKIAGGPAYLGVDTVNDKAPPEIVEDRKFFMLPSLMDHMIEDWRAIADAGTAEEK